MEYSVKSTRTVNSSEDRYKYIKITKSERQEEKQLSKSWKAVSDFPTFVITKKEKKGTK